ncbi:MAG: beta-(1-6) glucans synthase, partial [Pseudorhodoplanes sp.]
RPSGDRRAERVAGAALALSAVYIAVNEGFANWQSLWFCALIAALGLTLLRPQPAVAPGS